MKIKEYKNSLLVIMYHHIVTKEEYFNGISFIKFEQQINYIRKNYNILNPFQFYEKIEKKKFDKKDCIITFDDGYQTQYKYAFKLLNKFNLKGFFFPMMLDNNCHKIHHINKIHFLLKSTNDKEKLLEEINFLIKKNNVKFFKKLKKIINNIETKNFYDNSIDIIIKRLLQRDLPLLLREKICNQLFSKIKIKKNILKKMYMTNTQLKNLKKKGHEIGVHTSNHFWLSNLTKKEQTLEIKKSINFLKEKKLLNKKWSFCYPFGDYNNSTIQILKSLNCSAAFAVKNKAQNIKKIKKYEISRIDCNEIIAK